MATTDEPMTAGQMRDAEDWTMLTTPESALMDRAASAVAHECGRLLASRPDGVEGAAVVVLAGSGNNGGDALLAGALLAERGAVVRVVPCAERLHERGAARLSGAGGVQAELSSGALLVAGADLVIDGIVGLGSRAGLREPVAGVVALIPRTTPVVAVDLPSGLEADSSADEAPHVIATSTVTFTAPKHCLVEHPAAAAAGRVVIADVGVDLGWRSA
ncbi:NAD(P)H-hydrate epimerase [Demequina capsici]|uniref:NAD(P)H-hydrate epimerase n=1 Tax=Demequina capsici TaxID=3075620 RepID=A0AA96JBT3_9MICO|nr:MULTISPECIES: NAD(P)H-hydrate epimerase [unclassified Demequina]WNM25532.1 NAD(P)H-hydrate epimerase [Demequina sp. OYTSA14]WNM28423.1 NAD(P)H-hydrate epimerase [Demequina sp. PMTSA13]